MLSTINYSIKAADEMVEQEFTKAGAIFLENPPNSFLEANNTNRFG